MRVSRLRIRDVIVSVSVALGAAIAGGSAWGASGGEYAPIIEVGANFHTGDTGKSITGASEYVVSFRAEKRKGRFRPTVAADLGYARGNASIGTHSPAFTMLGAGFLGGVHVFPFTSGRFQPFFGGSGILGWNFLKLPAPPTGVEPNTQAISLGYEISAGVDLRFGNIEGNAIRIHGGMWSASSSLAAVSGFQLTGFRLTFGLSY